MDFVIVTGMSGAGKTQVINALEDVGYYCVDNVPPRLLTKFAELPSQSDGKISKIALVVDVRSKDMFLDYILCLTELTDARYQFKTLFMDCDTKTLVTRYKETRRRHPLMSDSDASIEIAITHERELLEAAKDRADFVIDTTLISSSQIKSRIRDMFASGINESMLVVCTSFGFKYGTPTDADLLFDVRCLPNPFYEKELKNKTGLEDSVREYVLKFPQSKGLIPRLFDLIDYLLPLYHQEGKSQLVVAIGCTGGKHRSVVFTELLATHLRQAGAKINISHRDITVTSKR